MTVLTYQITDAKRFITIWATENQKGIVMPRMIFESKDTSNNQFSVISVLRNKVKMKSRFPITGVEIGTIFTQV